MYCNNRTRHCVTMVLVALFSWVLAACGGSGGGGVVVTRYTVTATAGTGGSISPASITIDSGGTASFTVTPDSGYNINTVTGCGGTLVGNTYTTGAVTANCTVAASFVSSGLPTINIGANGSVREGDSGTRSLSFTVTLSALANGNVDVSYSTSDGTATGGSDYTVISNGLLTIPAGSTTATISVDVLGDTDIESNETFTLTLRNPSANAALGFSVTATGTILNDDVGSPGSSTLNDTGVTVCSSGTAAGQVCNDATAGTDAYPGQDAEYGRDATANDDSDGRAGFSFTKLDSNGVPLADQTVSATIRTVPWDCVQDNVTGLVWEVKTYSGLRDQDYVYTWYNSSGVNDGGAPGTPNGGTCADSSNCDTEKYVAAVNAVGLCGQTDWRLPTVAELSSLVDSSNLFLSIDINYFPNTMTERYWSSTPSAPYADSAMPVEFTNGDIYSSYKSNKFGVRLVRGGQ